MPRLLGAVRMVKYVMLIPVLGTPVFANCTVCGQHHGQCIVAPHPDPIPTNPWKSGGGGTTTPIPTENTPPAGGGENSGGGTSTPPPDTDKPITRKEKWTDYSANAWGEGAWATTGSPEAFVGYNQLLEKSIESTLRCVIKVGFNVDWIVAEYEQSQEKKFVTIMKAVGSTGQAVAWWHRPMITQNTYRTYEQEKTYNRFGKLISVGEKIEVDAGYFRHQTGFDGHPQIGKLGEAIPPPQ